MTKGNMGYVYKTLGNLAQARSSFQEAHDIFLRSLGPDHHNTMQVARALEQLPADPSAGSSGADAC